MSLIPPSSIKVIASSVDMTISDEAAQAMKPDVEYRIREIIQEAMKFMRHSKRTKLVTEDVNNALQLMNVEPLYGFGNKDPLRFVRAAGHPEVFYVEDREVQFSQIIEGPLPKCPVDASVRAHWLAVEGVQPDIPENASADPDRPVKKLKKEAAGALEVAGGGGGGAGGGVGAGKPKEVQPAIKHVLSKELQLYFERITELAKGGEGHLQRAALESLATDTGLHPLLPYFTQFINDEVSRGLKDVPLLASLVRIARALLSNPSLDAGPYLHQLMPSLLTCVVAKRLGTRASEDHWAVRNQAARCVADVCARMGSTYQNLQPRIARTMLRAFLDPGRPLTTHYGAIVGLAALGPRAVQALLLPNLGPYLQLLLPELGPAQANEMKRFEATRCYGALVEATGRCVHHGMYQWLGQLAEAEAGGSGGGGVGGTAGAEGTAGPSKPKPVVWGHRPKPALPPAAADSGKGGGAKGGAKGKGGSKGKGGGTKGKGGAGKGRGGNTRSKAKEADPGPEAMDTREEEGGGKKNKEAEGASGGDGGTAAAAAAGDEALKGAWREDRDFGQQVAALGDLFGEAMVPYVPTPELVGLFI